MMKRFAGCLLFAVWPWLVNAAGPEWIWNPKDDSPASRDACFARRTFTLDGPVERAYLIASGDNHIVVHLNGAKVVSSDEWAQPGAADVASNLVRGANLLAVHGRNDGGIAAMILRLTLVSGGRTNEIVTDGSWLTSSEGSQGWMKAGFDDHAWKPAKSLGKLGMQPWGDVFGGGGRAKAGRQATPAEQIAVLDGFKVELLRSAEPGEGSWVSMAVDQKGRLIVSPQGGEPMLRFALDAAGQVVGKEPIDIPVRSAMGLLYHEGSLFVNGGGPDGYCLYRVTDTNADDRFDTVKLVHKTEGGGGEHGTHGVVMGPEGRLYVVNGNFVRLPTNVSPRSPHQHYAGDDLALPRAEDGNGFGAGEKTPGGYILRMNPDGSDCEVFAAGERNTYDIAFNEDGELFGFDSDMEWDWAMPWYRPTRVFHAVSGAEHGYRGGSAKWPEWYEDSLPAVVNIGIGSPTGVRFGTGAKFPAKYQRALLAMDWSYGRILAVHLESAGAGYRASFETLLSGKPLNVTDLEVGPDGALYFITGGRGTQSGLYRVTYTGPESTARADGRDPAGKDARALRRQLEVFHGRVDAAAVDAAWPHLGSADRYLRYAARIALEFQPVEQWRARALAESDARRGLTALLALARMAPREAQAELFSALKKFPMPSLDEELQLLKLRVLEVSVARQGRPSPELVELAINKLAPLFPGGSPRVNRELGQLLVAFEAPGITAKVMDMARKAASRDEQIYWLFISRGITNGWTREDRLAWFDWFTTGTTGIVPVVKATNYAPEFVQWFTDVQGTARDGSSAAGFIRNMRKDGVASLSNRERFELSGILTRPVGPAAPRNQKKPLQFVKAWQMADLESDLAQVSAKGRNLERGREAYETALCLMCHRYGNEGGAVGPDLTAIATRFSRRDTLESILDPSKVVSEQYAFTTVKKKDGAEVSGRLVEDNATSLWLMQNPLAPDEKIEVKKADIVSQGHSPISPMPPGLLNLLTKEEVLDLLAFLESAGRKQ